MIRVLIADDEDMIRTALAALLRLEEDLEIVGECRDGEQAVAEALRLQPDELLDHRGRREALSPQQELARERRPVQLAQREDPLGHGSTLTRWTARASSSSAARRPRRSRPG